MSTAPGHALQLQRLSHEGLEDQSASLSKELWILKVCPP